MIIHLIVSSIIFAIFYTLVFLLLGKGKMLKVAFGPIFFFTLIMYFVLTLLMNSYLNF